MWAWMGHMVPIRPGLYPGARLCLVCLWLGAAVLESDCVLMTQRGGVGGEEERNAEQEFVLLCIYISTTV